MQEIKTKRIKPEINNNNIFRDCITVSLLQDSYKLFAKNFGTSENINKQFRDRMRELLDWHDYMLNS